MRFLLSQQEPGKHLAGQAAGEASKRVSEAASEGTSGVSESNNWRESRERLVSAVTLSDRTLPPPDEWASTR